MKIRVVAMLFLGSFSLVWAQEANVPRDLSKTFDRYARAWVDGDWERVFDTMAPTYQQTLLKTHGDKRSWAKHQANDLKDTITEISRKQSYQMMSNLFSFAILVKGKRPGGEPFSISTFASFEWIDDRWCLVDPVYPRQAIADPRPVPNTPAKKPSR